MVKDMGKTERKGVMVMGVLVWLVAFLFWLGIYRASAEEPPFFRAEPQYPSVFMIFDNSDSMQDVPYLDVNGLAVRPSGRMWKENVKLNSDGRVIGWQYVTWPDVLPDLDENANPDRKADGGNHPASKLYQAKLALNVILNHIKDVNLGFATYMTQRDPKVTAKYYKGHSQILYGSARGSSDCDRPSHSMEDSRKEDDIHELEQDNHFSLPGQLRMER